MSLPVSVPLADAEARDRARGSSSAARRGRLLIEAAAGSGKTSVLVDRVLSYVLAGERSLHEMVVVTFTEAAAAELRLRLRRRLVEELARPAADAREPSADGGRADRLRGALRDLESARVGTIHALCFELLRQAPIEAGVDPFFRVADELESRLEFLEAWEEFLRSVDGGEDGLAIASELDLLAETDLRRAALKIAEVDPSRLPRPLGRRPRAVARSRGDQPDPRAWIAGSSSGSALHKDLEQFRAGSRPGALRPRGSHRPSAARPATEAEPRPPGGGSR